MRWHSLDETPPDGTILAWHRYNQVMVTTGDELYRNRFYTHWQEVPARWVDPQERMPEKTDADVFGCVLVRRTWGEILQIGWWQVRNALHINGWAKTPPGP